MKIAPKKIIKFFDEKSKDKSHYGSDVTAIIGLLGEDLLLGVSQHYWKTNEGVKSRVLSYKCTRGKQKGSRLDAWLLKELHEKRELYQVELKNWAAYAIPGKGFKLKELKLDATEQEIQDYSKERWDYYFAPEKIPQANVRKVLEKMKNPSDHENLIHIPRADYENLTPIPLVCFWFFIAKNIKSPYSKRRYSNGKQVHVFSASAYLRGLKKDCIDIAMPRVKTRKDLLSKLILSE